MIMSSQSNDYKHNRWSQRRFIDADVVDVEDNCYVVHSTEGETYKLPQGIGEHTEIENGQLLQISENTFLRLRIPEPDEGTGVELEEYNSYENSVFDEGAGLEPIEDNPYEIPETNDLIWKSSRHPTSQDIDATVLFLEFRSSEKYDKLFSDKKTTKSKVWQMVANDMQQKGFKIGTGREAVERCRQKYYNLQKAYLSLNKQNNRTGGDRKNLPKYYDLLHKTFGPKHSINPVVLVDSLSGIDAISECTENAMNIEEHQVDDGSNTPSSSERMPSCSHCTKNDLSKKVKSNTDRMIEAIKEMHQQQSETNERHFQRMQSLIEQQNDYKKEFLEIFKSLHNRGSKLPE